MDTVKFSISLRADVRHAAKAAAAVADLELSPFIQKILLEYLVREGWLGEQEVASDRTVVRWQLLNRAGEIACEICRNGKFDEHINFNVIKACFADPDWFADYTRLFGGSQDQAASGLRDDRNLFHRELGAYIPRRIGGKVKKKQNGKPAYKYLRNEVIQQYTLIASFDPETVEASVRPEAPFFVRRERARQNDL